MKLRRKTQLPDIRLKVKTEVDKYFVSPEFDKKTYTEVVSEISERKNNTRAKEKLDINLKNYLNYLEGIALE